MKFLGRLRRQPKAEPMRRVKVEITCPHGEFIPGSYALGDTTSRYGCDRCGMQVRLSTFTGEIDW